MKRFLLLVVSIMACQTILLAGEKKIEVSAQGDYLFPGQDEVWDRGIGGTLQLTYWISHSFGIGMSAGVQKWDFNEDPIVDAYEYLGDGISAQALEGYLGDATMIPLGISGLYRVPVCRKINLKLEAGAKYIFVNTKADWAGIMGYEDEWFDVFYPILISTGKIDIENGAVAFLNADVNVPINDTFALFLGCGYQLDIIKGKIKVTDTIMVDSESVYDIGAMDTGLKNELKAFYVRAGASILF